MTATAVAPAREKRSVPLKASLQMLPIALLMESPHNPRKHFDKAKLEELADSIRKSGILTPLLVRALITDGAPTYEIAAGHRRFRASKLAGLDAAPCVVREMDDATFLEVLTIENLQREDVHPLEEAEGYRSLITELRYDVAKIADRIGRSHRYVYDRLGLLKLTDAAKEHFYADRISTRHAVLLARLSPEDQARALDPHKGGVFTHEQHHWHPDEDLFLDEEEGTFEGKKPVSVRELEGWIDRNVRFDPAAVDLPELFPETAAVVRQAEEQEEKIVKITHEHYVQPDARSDEERTVGPRSWKRADGKGDSKTCEHSVVGVVAIGPGRGDAFRVCIEKKKCKVHWASEIREAAKRAKDAESGEPNMQEKWRLQDEKRKQEEAREQAKRARWVKARSELLKAFAAAVKKAKLGTIVDLVLEKIEPDWGFTKKRAEELVPQGATAESVLRHLAMLFIGTEASNEYWMEHNLIPIGKAFGVDVKTIVDDVAPAKEEKQPAAKKKSSGKPAKRSKRK